MKNLMTELNRLYLPAGVLSATELTQHLSGQTTRPIKLTTEDGLTRSMVIVFNKIDDSDEAPHWNQLCSVANILQSELDFPAPAVSISGANSYGLWLSLESPVPAAQVQQFLELLGTKYFPDMDIRSDAVSAPIEIPPCMHQGTGKWAAFIHPGLGASFADESGLEMAPPIAGQIAFLKDLHSISTVHFLSALKMLQQSHGAATVNNNQISAHRLDQDGLLLKDATLEDIVNFLHSKNIEPTFRHLIPK